MRSLLYTLICLVYKLITPVVIRILDASLSYVFNLGCFDSSHAWTNLSGDGD